MYISLKSSSPSLKMADTNKVQVFIPT